MKRLITSTILLLLLKIGGFSQEYTFDKLSTRQGLSHSTVYDITQDAHGFVWIGTREGLNRYDSYEIKTYYADTSKGLPSNQILSLLATEEQLYIGTSKGLSKYLPAQDKIESIGLQDGFQGQVRDLYEAKDGTIFVCTSAGLFSMDTLGASQLIIDRPGVSTICNFKTNVFWLAVSSELLLINHLGEVIKQYDLPLPSFLPIEKKTNNIHAIFQDHSGDVWIGTDLGLFRYDSTEDRFNYFSLGHQRNWMEANVIRAIAEDQNQKLWLGTELGLFKYDKLSGQLQHFGQSFSNSAHTLSDKSIYSIYISKENIIWLGTYFGGVNYAKPKNKGFFKLLPGEAGQSLSGKAVSQMIQDSRGDLWIATEDGGITIFNKEDQDFRYLMHDADQANSLSCNNVHSLFEDREGYIWIGTFLGGLNRFDPRTGQNRIYLNERNNPNALSNNYVYAIHEDRLGKLWIGTQAGLNIFVRDKDHFEPFHPEVFGNQFIYDLIEDQWGDIWICTRSRGIYRYHAEKEELQHFGPVNADQYGLQANQIISVYEDSKGKLWFGTLEGGLVSWDREKEKFSSLTQEDGLPNNNVYGVLEDGDGLLWITTNKGLSQYHPEKDSFTHFSTVHGLTTNQFNFKSFFKDDAGWMYFGTVNGLNYFHPDSAHWDISASKVYFTSLKLFNKEVPIKKGGNLNKHIDQTDTLILKHWQNVITLEFVAINYYSAGNNEYAYYLEGFENSWNRVGNKRTATYTNLSPGNYVFHVKSTNIRTSQSENERLLHVKVLPPWWLSAGAFFVYGVLILLLILAYAGFIRFLHKQKLAVQLERVEKEKIREINQHKLNFFTFISHEFKTPLTLIIASIEKFFSQSVKNSQNQQELLSIKKNATRLHHLIEQLMEFRKVETDHASLELRKGDLILFIRDTFTAFTPLFNHKELEHQIKSSHAEYYCYFDAGKIEMILANILSNAIKNTDHGGKVNLDVNVKREKKEEGQTLLNIKVSDTGTGISKEEHERVFSPFYQSRSGQSDYIGSGIGLALVKSLIEYLKGNIEIQSHPKIGTTINISVPLWHKPITEGKKIVSISGNSHPNIKAELLLEKEVEEGFTRGFLSEKELIILIVEDNRELLKFLHRHFAQKYKVLLAKNGEEALAKVEKSLPDLIISDIRMPEMDGVRLCKEIKQEPHTNHIPFILLTAKNGGHSKIEGLSVGADAFMSKPFNLQELDLLVHNMLASRKSIQSHVSNLSPIGIENIPANNQDKEFLRQVVTLIEENYHRPDLSIAGLAKMMGISRSLLHLKMKKITNMNASDFIKQLRMNKAAELLKKGNSISEVAYQVGFNDPNYFSKVFKKEFKVSPSNYVVR